MSPPDFSDPESKLKLRLTRPSRFVSAYGRFIINASRTLLGFMALSLVWMTGVEIWDGGFRWALIGEAFGILVIIGAFFVAIELFARLWTWMERRG
ncbi:hypothetical protein ACFPIF_11140 [Brevundimonas faecalis]|uniref:hypothetical protein n=1 Tax=Brevundimonas faecalis TaxID=947378 RepID=UPI00361AAAE3